MPYSCEIHSSIDDFANADWASVAGRAVWMDARFIRAVERGQSDAGKFWSVIVRDDQQRPVAAACLSLLTFDLAMLAGGVVQKVGITIRHVFPDALKYKAVFCGLPVSAGQNHLNISNGASVTDVLRVLAEEMTKLARSEGARFLVFKEFDDDAAQLLAPLGALGFYRGESPPMNHFPVHFGTFAEYRAALKAPYRSKIVRSERKFAEQNLRLEHLRGGEALAEKFTDEVHRMYLAVVEKSLLRLEVLSADWFREMAGQLGHESIWTAIYDGDELLAWAYGLLSSGEYHSLFGGVDYRRNSQTDAYFNLMYHELDFALRQNVGDIQLGQTADDFKGRLGATQSKRWFFVKPLRWKAKAVLSIAGDSVLPTYPPPTERHVFHVSSPTAG